MTSTKKGLQTVTLVNKGRSSRLSIDECFEWHKEAKVYKKGKKYNGQIKKDKILSLQNHTDKAKY